jgi:TrmH family RNA methyltransferase
MQLSIPSKFQLKTWTALQQAKVRRREQLFLAEGAKVVQELLRSDWEAKALLILSGKEDHFTEISSAACGKVERYRLTEKQWDRLSQDKTPEGVMAVAAFPAKPAIDFLPIETNNRLLLLHEINNPNNLGALLRTAHWFGFGTVLISAGSVDYTHPKVVRSAMGSLFHLRVGDDMDLNAVLPVVGRSYHLVGSDVRSGAPPHPHEGRIALLLGSESHGLPRHLLDLTDEQWRIPGDGDAESLSLPQAAAIMMYACTRK